MFAEFYPGTQNPSLSLLPSLLCLADGHFRKMQGKASRSHLNQVLLRELSLGNVPGAKLRPEMLAFCGFLFVFFKKETSNKFYFSSKICGISLTYPIFFPFLKTIHALTTIFYML